jgi:hypothetical protein
LTKRLFIYHSQLYNTKARLVLLILIALFNLISMGNTYAQELDTSAQQTYIHQIHVTGRHKTRQTLILRELSVKMGEYISFQQQEQLLNQNKLRLLNLRLFTEVTIHSTPVGKDSVDWNIEVYDRFPIMPEPEFEFADRNFNVWWTEQNRDLSRLNLGLTLVHNNFRGNREVLSVTGQLGYTQKVGLSYAIPFIDNQKKHGIGLSFFGIQNKEIAYQTLNNKLQFYRSDNNFMQRRFDASLWYTYRPAYAFTHTVQLSFSQYWISDTIAYMNPEYLGKGAQQEKVMRLLYKLEYNGVDNWNYPLKGNRFIGVIEQKWGINNKNVQSSIHLHYDHFCNIYPKWYTSLILRARLSSPQQQPYIFRQNLGYEYDYVRGYEYQVIDGGAFALARLNFKRTLMDKNIKLPIKYLERIPIKVYAKIYGDIGYGYDHLAPSQNNYANRALYATGIGVDIITLYDLKLRIEYTLNHLNEKGLYLHRNGE